MVDLDEMVAGTSRVTSTWANLIKDYIQDGTHKINTLSLDIGGTEVITSSRNLSNIGTINGDAIAKKHYTYTVDSGGNGDYTTIQAAFTALGTAEGTVFVRKGYYEHNAKITMYEGQALVGEGSAGAPQGVMFFSKIADGSPLISFKTGDRFINVENIYFISSSSYDSKGIYFEADSNVGSVKWCRFVDFKREALHSYDAYDHWIESVSIEGCGAVSGDYASVFIEGNAAFGSNEFKFHSMHLEKFPNVALRISKGLTNTFFQCKFHGVLPTAANYDVVQIDSNSSNNKFFGCNWTQGGTASYVDCAGVRNEFIGNTVSNSGGKGLEISGTQNIVVGNIANNNTGLSYDIVPGNVVHDNIEEGLPYHLDSTGCIARISNVDMKSVANTALLVVPSDKRVVLTSVVVRNVSTSGSGTAPVWNIGDNSATYNNWIGSATLAAVTTNTYEQRQTNNASIPTYSNTTIYFRVSTASTATSMTCDVILQGYYVKL